jgi:DNA-binding protein WhiA
MEFENARVVREVSGQVNRRLNFETANIDKTIGSAMRQVAAIETLEQLRRLDALPPALREIAQARRAHPDLNLSELARALELSKSAVNHRLRRLMEIAETHVNGERAHAPAESNGRST